MSRINNEADRLAYANYVQGTHHHRVVMEWLKANPQVGELASGKYYIIKNGEMVNVEVLEEFA